ncbi:MAG: hypothetical protein JNL79_23595 [Myxococcales bacterium]|nr:hypothetical protein [Myxococcales bacterium]
MRCLAPFALALVLTACGSSSTPAAETDSGVDIPDVGTLPRVSSQDVSILFPLGTRLEALPTADGILSRDAFAKVPAALDARQIPGDPYAALRIVAVRLDPCFGVLAGATEGCRPQVRVVLQQLRVEAGQVVADDGAVHAFFDLGREELVAFAKDVVALGKLNGGVTPGPLGVHPILEKQGADGAFGKAFVARLRAVTRPEKLRRMTFFVRTAARASTWNFGVFDGAALTRATVFGTSASEVTLTAMVGEGPMGARTPATTSADDPMLLANVSTADAASPADRAKAFAAALRVENPKKHTPDTVDCVSCHVAEVARRIGEARFGLSAAGHVDAFVTSADTSKVGTTVTPSLENVHAFGWLGRDVGISQRTAFESALAAQALDAMVR